jgi:hypothetical protein
VVAELIYAAEQFGNALHDIALSEGPLKERLREAYADHALFAVINAADPGPPLSAALPDRVAGFAQRLTWSPATAHDDTLTATIRTMDDDDVRYAIQELISITLAIQQELGATIRSGNVDY